jgi:hypothetical protein
MYCTAIPIPGHDSTGQDTLDGAAVVFGEDPGLHAEDLQPPWEVETLLRTLDKSGGSCRVLNDVDADELKTADSLDG